MAAKTIALKTSQAAAKKKTSYKRKTEETHTISPSVAAAWLEKNISNRRPRKNHIRRLAIAMRSGLWRETDDPIRFDWDGNLFDGQHRLMACVEADTPFKSKVIYGYAPEMRHVVDSGIHRTAADSLAMTGAKNASHLASALRVLCHEAMGVGLHNYRSAPTKDHIEAMHRLHPNLAQYVFTPGALPRGINIGNISAINYILSCLTEDPDTAAEFVQVIKTGIPSRDGCPIHRYRERILAGVGFRNRSETWEALKYVVNAWLNDEKMRSLKVSGKTARVALRDLDPQDLTKGVAVFDKEYEEEEADG